MALLAIVGFIDLTARSQDVDLDQEQTLEILAFVLHHPASDQEMKDKASSALLSTPNWSKTRTNRSS